MKTLKLILILSLIFVTGFVSAQTTFTWTGNGDGTSFTDPDNWSTGSTPSTIDTIVFDNAQVTITNLPVADINLSAIKIINNSHVIFESASNSVNFFLFELDVEPNCFFVLRGTEIITISSTVAHIEGTIDAGSIHVFNIGTVNFTESAEVITANSGGFSASIIGSYSFTNADSFSIYYNGITLQSTGLLNVGTNFGKIIIENTSGVFMDTDIQIGILELTEGNFDIGSFTLTVSGTINYQNGLLAGSSTSSLAVINGNTTGNPLSINFDPSFNTLSTFTLNRPDKITAIGTDLTIQTQLNIDSGLLRVNALLNTTSAPINSSQDNYIIFGSNGHIKKQIVAGNSVQIDVGTQTIFAPISINPIANDTFFVSVHDSIYSNGNFGISLVNRNVNLRWDITSSSNTVFDLILFWDPVAQNGDFDITNAYISNYTGTEWDNPGGSSVSIGTGLNSLTRSLNTTEGLFGIFSGTNNLPTASDNEVTIAINQVYVFNTDEFNYSDPDGDAFAKIMINDTPAPGSLFLDNNFNNSIDAGEIINAGDQVNIHQIINQYLKFAPVTEDFGSPYSAFTFAVSDGMNYSTDNYIMHINVTDNVPPEAQDQTFTIPEYSPNGTIVGKLIASDSNAGQTLSFYPSSDGTVYSDAFQLAEDGTISVNNSNLLEYSIHPEFNYSIDVCDNGNPILCTSIRVTIQLTEVTRDIEAANFISPNGDGHNDKWLVKGIKDDVFEAFIFNSSGKLLFYSSDYKNGWDGTSRSKELPPGVYYYLLKSPTEEFKGTITLVR